MVCLSSLYSISAFCSSFFVSVYYTVSLLSVPHSLSQFIIEYICFLFLILCLSLLYSISAFCLSAICSSFLFLVIKNGICFLCSPSLTPYYLFFSLIPYPLLSVPHNLSRFNIYLLSVSQLSFVFLLCVFFLFISLFTFLNLHSVSSFLFLLSGLVCPFFINHFFCLILPHLLHFLRVCLSFILS